MDPTTAIEILVPLGAFLVLAAAFLVVGRRASRALTDTRDAERFRVAVTDLAGRIDAALGYVIVQVDAVRRHHASADQLEAPIDAGLAALDGFNREAAGLRPPAGGEPTRDNLMAELERASRALEMVDHGCSLVAAGGGRGHELEAQTAIKRGYLNALHAREAIARHAASELAGPPGGGRRWVARRPSQPRM